MTDVHSHILFGIDDGSSSIEESLKILKGLKSIGFDNVILTPHFIEGSTYSCPNNEKLRRFNILKDEIKKNNIDINIYLGNEIFINDKITDYIKQEEIYTLNNTKYVLVEFPLNNKLINAEEKMYELIDAGLVPVIAHPERYVYFQDDYSLVDSLREIGVKFQSNYGSILDYYGKNARKLMKYMLKNKYIDYLGTDIHHIDKAFVIDNFSKIEKKIIKITGKDYFEKIKKNCNNLVR